MNAETYLANAGIRAQRPHDDAYLRLWCAFADRYAGQDPLRHAGPRGLERFRAWIRQERRGDDATAIEAARRVRALVGEPAGLDYRTDQRRKPTFCPCGSPAARAGCLMCESCLSDYAKTRARQGGSPLGVFRQALDSVPASAMAAALNMTVRDVWNRFVGRVEVTRDEASVALQAVQDEQRRMPADHSVSSAEFVHRGMGFVYPDGGGF